ncbi:hypothetical protein MRBLWO14_000286 [Microbacterium sp. LWO14-1.2]|uniref:hypothetical protein n=1 Tax=Microbacterium sp. LWO14-1.2 TaxID=3135263 RepID=UPI00313A100F
MTTISKLEYAAKLLNPDRAVRLDGGQLTLDSERFTHVAGNVTLAVDDPALLDALDPRLSSRLQITATRDGGTPRVFDLGIREMSPDRQAGTVRLQLASDEAILQDFAQLVDDPAPRQREASLRSVCNYVLGKIGTQLQPGTEDANVTAYWEIVNQLTNPRLANDAAAWQTGSGATAGNRVVMSAPLPPVGNTAYQWTAAPGDSNVVPLTSRYRVTPGKWYVFTAYLCSGVTRQARAAIQWWSAGGSVASSTAFGAFITSDVTAFRRLFVIAQCPPGVEQAVPYINTVGNASGNLHYGTCGMFYEGNELVGYFDGATPDTTAYDYAWQAGAHASTSSRTPRVERSPEALIWRAGTSAMAFLEPLLKVAGLRIVCDERRRFTLRAGDYRAEGNQTYRQAVNIATADESVSRDDDSWFDAAVYEYVWTDADGIEQRRVDAFALPPSTGMPKVLRVELRDTPYPGPGRAEHIVRRAQGRGRTFTVSAVPPTLLEQTDQPLSIRLEGSPIQTGIAASVEFNLDDDHVTVTSRTTDTPADAWILVPDEERWIDAPPNAPWNEE